MIVKWREFFIVKWLCYNCVCLGYIGKECCSRGCYKCKSKYYISLCDKFKGNEMQDFNVILSGYMLFVEEKFLFVIVLLKIWGIMFWVYLDIGLGRNFIFKEVVNKLKLNLICYEMCYIVMVNGMKKQFMLIYDVIINLVDSKVSEKIEIIGSKFVDFIIIKRFMLIEFKEKF